MKPDRWLIYALGGGWGHLNRALALARRAAPERAITILTNSPYAHQVRSQNAELLFIKGQTPVAVGQEVLSILNRTSVRCLIVDTFPRGLAGELAAWLPEKTLPRILVHRDLNPRYVAAKQIDTFRQQNFDLILVPAAEGHGLPSVAAIPTVITPPWLACNPHELMAPEVARQHLGVKDHQKLVLVLAAGNPEELAWYGQVTRALSHHRALPTTAVRCLAATCPPVCPPDRWRFHYPAMELLAAADVVVGGGGYNTVAECTALGLPLVARVFPRLYDRQQHRLNSLPGTQRVIIDSIEAALGAVQTLLSRSRQKATKPNFKNGTVNAVQQIEQLLELGRVS